MPVDLNLRDVPSASGCYQFYAGTTCLYVGKAVNLRQRLAYYLAGSGPDDVRIASMVQRADRVEWVVLASDADALLTEAAMIAEMEPVYNIKLREDHPYPAVAIDTRGGTERLMVWRGPARSGVEVYGPYPGRAARSIVDAILDVAPVRTCDTGKFALHQRLGRGCMLAAIGRCAAPCVDPTADRSPNETATVGTATAGIAATGTPTSKVTSAHADAVEHARRILRGGTAPLRRDIEARMRGAAADQRYETAGRLRDQLAAIDVVRDAHLLTDADGRDLDVIGTCVDAVGGAAVILKLRQGALVRCEYHVVDAGYVDVGSLIDAVVARHATGAGSDTATPIVHGLVVEPAAVGGRVIRTCRRGKERRLVELADTNAAEVLRRSRLRRGATLDARRGELERLRAALGLRRAPLRLEAVDISHLGGAATVSVVSVLCDGVAVPRAYRKYRLGEHGGDDYAAMREVLTRRLADSIDHKTPWPHLLLIDGGPAQLAVAVEVINELGVADHVEVASLAKRLEEVFLPGRDGPVVLEPDDPALLLLQRARDETHRASNAFQRSVASRRLRRDFLDDVDGLGPVRKQRLLDAAGGWRGLETIDRDTLDTLTFLPAPVREAVWTTLTNRRK